MIDKKTAVRIALLEYLFVDVKLLDMMNTAIQNGEKFDEEAEYISVNLLNEIRGVCKDIRGV